MTEINEATSEANVPSVSVTTTLPLILPLLATASESVVVEYARDGLREGFTKFICMSCSAPTTSAGVKDSKAPCIKETVNGEELTAAWLYAFPKKLIETCVSESRTI